MEEKMATNLARMWKEMLDLCNVRADENLVILNCHKGRTSYAQVAMQAAEAVAANVSYLEVADTNKLPISSLAAIEKADLLLDFAFSHDERLFKFLANGLRILVTVEPPEILSRMFPTQDDKRRCIAALEQLKKSSRMRVVSEAGTAFTVSLGEFSANCQYGFSELPGRWDQWPGAFVYSYPNEGSANGTLTLDRGDILLPTKCYIQSPIRLAVKNGYISQIDGGFDAHYLSDILKSYNDPEVYAISHLGWGLSYNGHWNVLGMYDKADIEGQDSRAFYGNFLFSTGPNTPGGGKRSTPCHFDIPMRNCSVFLDEQPVVLNGDIVQDNQKFVRAAE